MLIRIGMPPAIAGRPRNTLSTLLITTRTLGNSLEIAAGDVAEAFEQHRARPHLSPFECLQLASRADLGLRLHCRDHDDAVVDFGLDLAPAQPEPFGDLERLDVPAAPVETYLAE